MKSLLPCGRKRPIPPLAPSDSNWRATLNQFLASKGQRNTAPREKVAEIALSQNSHFEIQSLIKKVQAVYPEISPATVYRSVSTLCEAGLLKETLQSVTGVTLYEHHDHAHHDHIICTDCGEIFEFHDEQLESAQHQATQKLNFQEKRHQHVIYAECGLLKKK